MGRRRLPEDAFLHYLSMGPERSYEALGSRYGVTKRAVAKRAKDEGWAAKLTELQEHAGEAGDGAAEKIVEAELLRHTEHVAELQDAMRDVVTPARFRAMIAALLKRAIQNEDIRAARLLIDRVLGRPRGEPLPLAALQLSGEIKTAADVRRASGEILDGVVGGTLSPEDGQRAATVLDATRKAIETEDLEKRLAEIEAQIEKEKRFK